MNRAWDKMYMLFAALALGAWAAPCMAADWPQWRGPTRDGVWSENGIVERFETRELPVKWRAAIGSGYSGPTVADGRLFVMDRITQPNQQERVHCFDAHTGSGLWTYAYECPYERVEYKAGPRASVTICDGRAYSLGTMGHLHCLDAKSGAGVWSHDCRREYHARVPVWGIAAAPLIEGDLVIVQIGGKDDACLMAFDKVTGQERWRSLNDPVSYAAPIIIEQAGRRVLVCITGRRIVGLDPQTGRLHWEHPFQPKEMVITIATPVFDGEYLLATSFYDGSLLLKVHQDKLAVEQVWRRRGASERDTDALHCCISTPILQGDHIYGADSHGELRCLDLKTGSRIWEDLTATPKARWSNIHMVRNSDKVWMFNERGELVISRLAPDGFHEISRARLIDPTQAQLGQRGGVTWSHPAFANRCVYARNDKELVCADLSAAKPAGVTTAQIERIWLTHKSADPSRVVVNWETAGPGNSVVRYGPTRELGRIREVDERVMLHHVEIPLDRTSSICWYNVQSNGDSSPVASFKTFPQDELRVAVIADLQGKPDLGAIVKDDVHILMTAGDNISNLWQDCGSGRKDCTKPYSRLIGAYPDLFRTTVFMPVLGNHDREIRPRGNVAPPEAVYDVEATAFREFFELPGEEWKWCFEVPEFEVRFIALDLNHISDMGTTWQTCHPFAAGSEQFVWYDTLTQRTDRRFVVTLYNERNSNFRAKENRQWHRMFSRTTACISGFGYFAERAVFERHPYFNTSVSGRGDRYPDPESAFLAGRDNYILLTFRRDSDHMTADVKALDGSLLDRTQYRGRDR